VTVQDVDRFSKWVRRAVSSSPLEVLRIRGEEYRGAHVSCDGLISHLSMKHSDTLRVLDMRWEFVGVESLKMLCNNCVGLQELRLSLNTVGLVCSLTLFSQTGMTNKFQVWIL
jgi:hypothetical protein